MKWLYYRFVYRRLMKFLHKHDWHHMQRNPYLERGKDHLWCHWCGARSVINEPSKSSLSIFTGNENDITK